MHISSYCHVLHDFSYLLHDVPSFAISYLQDYQELHNILIEGEQSDHMIRLRSAAVWRRMEIRHPDVLTPALMLTSG